MHDVPVDGAVIVNSKISESHRFFESVRQFIRDEARVSQGVKRLSHRVGRVNFSACDQVGGYVDGELHGTGEIQRDDVLGVKIACERLSGCGALEGDPLQASAQGFELFFDQVPIHARLLSARMRLR